MKPQNRKIADCPLNDRELEVVQQVANGHPVKLIAHNLNLSHHTINGYLTTARLKVGTWSSTGLACEALRKGWIQ